MKKVLFVLLISLLLIYCQKQDNDKIENTTNMEAVTLPEYEIIDEIKLISGEKMGEVLIKSFSRNTPTLERETILREIAKRKGFGRVELYSTLEAQKANYSDSFSKKHPDALKTGYLGSLNKGKFIPGESIYP